MRLKMDNNILEFLKSDKKLYREFIKVADNYQILAELRFSGAKYMGNSPLDKEYTRLFIDLMTLTRLNK